MSTKGRTILRRILLAAALTLSLAGLGASTGSAANPIHVGPVVDVSRDQTSQNETPLAINPANPQNMITGNNDWNYNDGCGVNTTTDGGKTWTPTVPDGFLPGITKYTNDPSVSGTGT